MVGTTLGCFTSLMVCILGVCSSFHFFFFDVFDFCLSVLSQWHWLSLFPVLHSRVFTVSLLLSLSPPCLPWVTPSQLSDLSLSIVLLENLSSPSPPSLLPTPAFQRAVIAPTAPPASCRISFTTAILPLPMSLFHSYLSYQTADCVRKGNTSVFAHCCILQVSSRSLTEASACICGIDRLWTYGELNEWISTATPPLMIVF